MCVENWKSTLLLRALSETVGQSKSDVGLSRLSRCTSHIGWLPDSLFCSDSIVHGAHCQPRIRGNYMCWLPRSQSSCQAHSLMPQHCAARLLTTVGLLHRSSKPPLHQKHTDTRGTHKSTLHTAAVKQLQRPQVAPCLRVSHPRVDIESLNNSLPQAKLDLR